MRIGGLYIETSLNAYDCLSMALLSLLWFLGIFAFRMGMAFLELLPELGALESGFQLSPRLQLLTMQPILTSLLLAVVLGPITHSVITRSSLFKVFYELSVLEETPQENADGSEEAVESDLAQGTDEGSG